jgi:uncharacterized phosphatase
MTDLYLVRHGETEWNRLRRIQGLTDIPLNDTGREQARRTGMLLTRRPIARVYASPLVRARETAELIAAELGVAAPVLREEFVERNYGAAEGMTFREIDQRYPPGMEVPGRETRDQVAARALPGLQAIAAAHPGESIAVVSHGGVIRAALMAAEPDWGFTAITNGSVHTFHVEGEDLRLVAFDDPIEIASADARHGDLETQNAVEARES